MARKYWEKAGLSDRIELRLGPAIDTLRSLPDEEMFDLAFIDADKGGYLGYWREVVPRVRAGRADHGRQHVLARPGDRRG